MLSTRSLLPTLLVALAALCPSAQAGTGKDAPAPEATLESPAFKLSGEFDVSQSYVGETDVRRGGQNRSLDEYNSEVRFVLTPRIPLGYLRLGAEWNRFSFGYSNDGSPLPNTLQSVAAVVGLDTKFSDSILVRFEAQPGLYGTNFSDVRFGQVRVPFIVGGTYIYSPDLQFIGGVSVDVDRKYPVFPGLGVRWKLAPKLVLNAVLPAPRLEYELSHDTTVHIGADLRGDAYRTDNTARSTNLERRLNRAVVTYSEIRVGGGISQKLSSSLTLSAEAGCQPYREFDYDRADVRYRPDGIAPYGQIAIHGAF